MRIPMEQFLRQMDSAAVTMGKYVHYAIEIGCKVEGDEITATPEQAALLDVMWRRLTEPAARHYVGKTFKLKSWAKPNRDGIALTRPKKRKARGWRRHVRRMKARVLASTKPGDPHDSL